MILPYDPGFVEAKQIMLCKNSIKPEFKQLAEWIDKTYGVKTINIYYDTIDDGARPRLEISFEHPEETESFSNHQGFDPAKQKLIGEKFKAVLSEQGLSKYKTENIWVIYGCFKAVARIDANDQVPQGKLDELKAKMNNPDLWLISKLFAGATIFVYSDDQLKKYQNTELHQQWVYMYFDMLTEYDEFGYFEREKFWIRMDSKENFDKNYESNWYYYNK